MEVERNYLELLDILSNFTDDMKYKISCEDECIIKFEFIHPNYNDIITESCYDFDKVNLIFTSNSADISDVEELNKSFNLLKLQRKWKLKEITQKY